VSDVRDEAIDLNRSVEALDYVLLEHHPDMPKSVRLMAAAAAVNGAVKQIREQTERKVRNCIAAEQMAAADRYFTPGCDHDDRIYGQGIRYAASIARGEQP
jgi:hypothetical protein